MIRTIQIDAFKSLYAVTLELGRVNCFIGANKTELLFDGNEEIVSDGVRNKKNLNPKAGLAALKLVDLDPCCALHW